MQYTIFIRLSTGVRGQEEQQQQQQTNTHKQGTLVAVRIGYLAKTLSAVKANAASSARHPIKRIMMVFTSNHSTK